MKPNRLRLKTRLAVRHARSLRLGIRDLVDINQILDAWFGLHHPELSEQMTIAGFQGRDWARMNISIRDTDKLFDALGRLYADAYVYSQDITAYELARAVGIKKALSLSQEQLQSALKTQWDKWKPGNRAAAALLDPPDGLRRLLQQRNLTIRGLASTTIDRIGTRLADGLRAGLTRDQVARSINEVLNDATRSVTIAQTEMSRAITQANQQIYTEAGVTMYEYLVVEPCDDCRENLKNSPQPADGDWPSGEPPVHPNCMCELVPYITMEVPDIGVGEEDILPITPTSPITGVSLFDIEPQPTEAPLARPTTYGIQDYRSALEEREIDFGFDDNYRYATQRWQGNEYRQIQSAVAHGEPAYDGVGGIFDIVQSLDNNMETFDSIYEVYRGQVEGLQNLKIGDVFRSPLYQAASTDPITAAGFSKSSGGVLSGAREGERLSILRIDIEDAKATVIPDSAEMEILIARNTTYTVERITEETINGVPMRIIDVIAKS